MFTKSLYFKDSRANLKNKVKILLLLCLNMNA